jgi:transcriptional regulator with PAS, ATPase and Fis domain
MRVEAFSPAHTRSMSEMHVASLSPEGSAIVADLMNAVKTMPHRDLRTSFEQIVARRAGVVRVRLRPLEATSTLVRHPRQPQPVTVAWNGVTFALDAEPHARDRDHVTRVLRSAAVLVPGVLAAQGAGRRSGRDDATALKVEDHADRLVGSSASMRKLRQEIEDNARADYAVLIEGETGVGKELVARQIHAQSDRRRGPFVPLNCAAVPETLFESELFGIEDGVATGVRARPGKFEQANGGILLLDEIAELPLAAQAKLLRVAQDHMIERVGSRTARRVDVRVIVSTNRSLQALVEQGQFRADLFFRLNALHSCVPPLRDHREDIVEIADAYLRKCEPARTRRLSRSAADVLCLHDWPGNVRELERVLERAMAQAAAGREILPEHLPPDLGQPYREVLLPGRPADESLLAMKRRYARLKFEQCGRNKRKTCAALEISYHTLAGLLAEEDKEEAEEEAEEEEELAERAAEGEEEAEDEEDTCVAV